ncbi:MAG: response regulator [Lachnospiraceae bacterium]|nr:response regulator [Lachnospiraceae bacterium]
MANILIVDDSRTSRKILSNILTAQGYVIVGEAIDGKDGVEKFKELKPDIVTLDITMPVMDGLEALKHGASEFVTKPFAEEEVIKVMQNIMS